jgi:hypothetical protein
MTTWTSSELDTIGAADELRIAPLRAQGTPHRPRPVWVVRDGDDLYVRSYRGTDGAWYHAAQATHHAQITAGDLDRDVILINETDPDTNARIDTAYRTKYDRFGPTYVRAMVATQARATTLKLLPR